MAMRRNLSRFPPRISQAEINRLRSLIGDLLSEMGIEEEEVSLEVNESARLAYRLGCQRRAAAAARMSGKNPVVWE
jgi:hypothetical protein